MNEEEIKISKVASRLEGLVKREFGVRFWKLKREDEIRTLRLAQWEEKYRVPLSWILHQLVPIWKQKFARYSGTAFGVKIATLVGSKSEEIIRQKLSELFPDGENIRQWKATEQQRQWAQYREGIRQVEDWEFPRTAVEQYQQRMNREREARKEFERRARLRPYRGNPWLD